MPEASLTIRPATKARLGDEAKAVRLSMGRMVGVLLDRWDALDDDARKDAAAVVARRYADARLELDAVSTAVGVDTIDRNRAAVSSRKVRLTYDGLLQSMLDVWASTDGPDRYAAIEDRGAAGSKREAVGA